MNVWCIIQAQVFFYPLTNCVYVDENPKVTEVPTEGMGSSSCTLKKYPKRKIGLPGLFVKSTAIIDGSSWAYLTLKLSSVAIPLLSVFPVAKLSSTGAPDLNT